LYAGTFAQTGVDDGWADVIVIAQAFHWCMDHGAAIKEFLRILKSDGVVSFVWNTDDKEQAPWSSQLSDYARAYDTGPRIDDIDRHWRRVFDQDAYKDNFSPPVEEKVKFVEHMTEEAVVARALSWSPFASLGEGEEKEKAKLGIREIFERGEGMKWVDKDLGILELPHETLVVVMQRVDAQ